MTIKQLFTSLGIIEGQAQKSAGSVEEFLNKARDHYCEKCEKFFKTTGGTKNHIRLAHK